jgi:hypothetical protein
MPLLIYIYICVCVCRHTIINYKGCRMYTYIYMIPINSGQYRFLVYPHYNILRVWPGIIWGLEDDFAIFRVKIT